MCRTQIYSFDALCNVIFVMQLVISHIANCNIIWNILYIKVVYVNTENTSMSFHLTKQNGRNGNAQGWK